MSQPLIKPSSQYQKQQIKQNPQSKSLIDSPSTKQPLSSSKYNTSVQTSCGCDSSHNRPFIGSREEAPEWMRYHDLTIGYRINFSSLKIIFKSLFILHNETINIWTHLIGAILLILTAILTCTPHLNTFESHFHTPLSLHQNHPMGSGHSFCQNMTQQCFNESLISHNNESPYTLTEQDQLAYDLCENQSDKHDCYLRKSHQRKFRNWLQVTSGIPLDKVEQIKLMMEKDIIPEFVHNLQDTVFNTTHQLIDQVRHYFNIYQNETAVLSKQQSSNQQLPQTKSTQKAQTISLAKWPLVFYLLCNSITLLCSVIFHWFYPLSKSNFLLIDVEAHQFCICTDFAGISFLFGFSPIPSIYYGMYCYFEVAEVYLTAMIVCSVLVFLVSFTDRFQDRNNSLFRVAIYFCLALLTVAPLTHMTINQLLFNNYNQTFSLANSMTWYVLGLIFYGIGGFFYVSQQSLF